MVDGLFNKVEAFLDEKEELSRMEEDLISSLEKEVIQAKYEFRKVEVDKTEKSDNTETFELDYPVLQFPENFTKENEVFYKAEHMSGIFHKYTLTGTFGTTLFIKEQASLYRELLQNEKGVLVCFNSVTGSVKYSIKIRDSIKYEYHRDFPAEDIIKESKQALFILKDNFFDNENNQNEKKFQLFLKTIGSTSSITLEKIISSFETTEEIQLTPSMFAKFKIRRDKKKGEVWLKNSKLGIKINAWKMWQTTIIVQAYFANNIKLEKQEYRIWQVENEKEFRSGLRFEDAINLIKKEDENLET